MVEMKSHCGKSQGPPSDARVEQSRREIAVLPSPSDKIFVKTIDGESIVPKKGEIAGFDASQIVRSA